MAGGVDSFDLQHRRWLVRQLRDIRIRLGITPQDIAEDLWVTRRAVTRLDDAANPNPHVGTLRRYAGAVDHTLALRLVRVPGLGPSWPVETMADLAAARRDLGFTQAAVGPRMGVTFAGVAHLERSGWPLLSSMQRYGRALGGRLVGRLVPCPPVDWVRVERVAAGRAGFGGLSEVERVELWRRHGDVAELHALARRWGAGAATLRRLAGVAV